MKKMIIIAALLVSGLAVQTANAQVKVGINFNIGSQPVWGPTGYDYAQYYYIPDANVYYSVPERIFIYRNGGRWVRARSLPRTYANIDLYRSYKVVINERDPWLRDTYNRKKYASYRRHYNQSNIRDSRDERYWEIQDHPHHSDWQRNHGNRNNDRRDDRRDNHNHQDHRDGSGRR